MRFLRSILFIRKFSKKKLKKAPTNEKSSFKSIQKIKIKAALEKQDIVDTNMIKHGCRKIERHIGLYFSFSETAVEVRLKRLMIKQISYDLSPSSRVNVCYDI